MAGCDAKMLAVGDGGGGVTLVDEATWEVKWEGSMVKALHSYLETDGNGETDEAKADLAAAAIALTLGKVAGKSGDVEQATDTVNRLASLLACPTDAVQLAAAEGIASSVRVLPGDRGKEILSHYLADIGGASARSAGYGLAGAVKGLRSKSLLAHGVLDKITEALGSKKDNAKRAGACVAAECLMRVLINIFEPYAAKLMPAIIKATGDKVPPRPSPSNRPCPSNQDTCHQPSQSGQIGKNGSKNPLEGRRIPTASKGFWCF
ncbi:hypothetical protein T484DRAFT_2377323 [Baffinella frigidus]|nr:hypothetical protein T484DRAFT_2377323 [Cryptophyta sp. CCMP2293]